MKHGARAISMVAVILQAIGLASWLTACTSQTDAHVVDRQDQRVLAQPLSVVQPCVPKALERLGIAVDSQDPGTGKVAILATSPSGLEVTINLEAMTSRKTYVAVRVSGYSIMSNWLVGEIADAIADEVASATESAPAGGAEVHH